MERSNIRTLVFRVYRSFLPINVSTRGTNCVIYYFVSVNSVAAADALLEHSRGPPCLLCDSWRSRHNIRYGHGSHRYAGFTLILHGVSLMHFKGKLNRSYCYSGVVVLQYRNVGDIPMIQLSLKYPSDSILMLSAVWRFNTVSIACMK